VVAPWVLRKDGHVVEVRPLPVPCAGRPEPRLDQRLEALLGRRHAAIVNAVERQGGLEVGDLRLRRTWSQAAPVPEPGQKGEARRYQGEYRQQDVARRDAPVPLPLAASGPLPDGPPGFVAARLAEVQDFRRPA